MEAFAGEACFTLGVVRVLVPSVSPWDIELDRSLDVVMNPYISRFAINLGQIGFLHLGTPYISFTRARIPLCGSRPPMGPS